MYPVRVPMIIIKSAFCSAAAHTGCLLEPIHIASGWSSGTRPLAAFLVKTGISAFSIKAVTSSAAPDQKAPEPTIAIGIFALLIISAAFSISDCAAAGLVSHCHVS